METIQFDRGWNDKRVPSGLARPRTQVHRMMGYGTAAASIYSKTSNVFCVPANTAKTAEAKKGLRS
ncbi:MAG: hypothetical protein VX107_19995 [Pseudomonadota bacterium]|nr:hypothetical protein [Pseudomonadota bacterium]